ncbi:WW domain [Trypanosoma vivax]|uniref:WW domain-containing protein n=1 Tax=Trypanosoma vivax (strain Y486) TaxID=1055687 RepID=G0TRF0_TRYVY|nr:hypothetical protein TRVL_04519 [Trypanosoma vivax]KAH8604054.1 WW domain [Trypanosoma vivax]CCC46514.1 conserved hypothetical protein [Trypanosoma vivax Y486]
MSVVLDVLTGENYEPSEAELLEYGKWLGMDLPADKPFLWIAREGLKAPLPEHWKACRSEKGELYYFNFKTGESIWDHPLDEHYRQLLQSEKKNPGPKSIANGAPKAPLPLNSKGPIFVERTNIQEDRNVTAGGKMKVHALKTLKQRKELPEELRIDIKGSGPSASETVDRSLTAQRLRGALTAAPVLQKASKADASSGNNSSNVSPDMQALSNNLDEQFETFKNEKMVAHQAAKETFVSSLKQDMEDTERKLREEQDCRLSTLRKEFQKKVMDEKERLEEEYANNVEQMKTEMSKRFEMEREKQAKVFDEKQRKELDDAQKQWEAEMAMLAKKRAQEMENIQAASSDVRGKMQQCTVELIEEAENYVKAYEGSYCSFVNMVRDTNDAHAKLVVSTLYSLLDRVNESYERATGILEGCYISEVEQVRIKFANEIAAMSQKFRNDLREMDCCDDFVAVVPTEIRPSQPCKIVKPSLDVGTQCECSCIPENLLMSGTAGGAVQPVDQNEDKNVLDRDGVEFIKTEIASLETAMAEWKDIQRKEFDDIKANFRDVVETELRAVIEGAIQGQRQLLERASECGDPGTSQVLCSEVADAKKDDKESAKCIAFSQELPEMSNIVSSIVEAVRAAIMEMPLFLLPQKGGCSSDNFFTYDKVSSPLSAGRGSVNVERRICGFPVSFQDQKLLLATEKEGVIEGRKHVESQRLKLEKRRYQLKMAKCQWKQDVMKAKKEGIKTSSQQGQLLNKIRLALDKQLRNLEYDEAILRGSEKWLIMKDRNVCFMEQQLKELEEVRLYDASVHSQDAFALASDFSKTLPDKGVSRSARHELRRGSETVLQHGHILDKIERRLEKITALMNSQQRRRRLSFSAYP